MAEMKGIKLCGECGNYDWKKHKCKIGCNDDSNAQASFYGDCPLPDVVPKSEVEKWFRECEELQGRMIELESEVAREIFEFIENNSFEYGVNFLIGKDVITELKKKYTESEDKG